MISKTFQSQNVDAGRACLRRLRDATEVLVGPGAVKQRLCEAAIRHLRDIDPNELPRDLAASCRELMDSLCTAPAVGGLGPVEATVRKMSDAEASTCASRVLDLYVALSGQDARESAPSAPRQLRLVGDE